MVLNSVCYSILMGVNTALETFVSQAYGRKNLRECGLYLHRAVLIITALFVPLCLILTQMPLAFRYFGMDPETSSQALDYVWFQMIGVLLHTIADSIDLMLAAMGYTYIIVILQVSVIPFHIVFCYLFVHYLGLGLLGAAYAANCTAVVTLTLQLAYAIRLKEISAAFYMPTRRAFRNLWQFFQLAAPGSLMLILEYLNWEILVLIAGTFNNNSMLAAMVIICTIGGSLITIPYGMSISAGAMVGNALGSNQPNAAKANAKLIMMASVLVSISVTLTLVVFKETIIMIYDD